VVVGGWSSKGSEEASGVGGRCLAKQVVEGRGECQSGGITRRVVVCPASIAARSHGEGRCVGEVCAFGVLKVAANDVTSGSPPRPPPITNTSHVFLPLKL
jgi:hypothetical protein